MDLKRPNPKQTAEGPVKSEVQRLVDAGHFTHIDPTLSFREATARHAALDAKFAEHFKDTDLGNLWVLDDALKVNNAEAWEMHELWELIEALHKDNPQGFAPAREPIPEPVPTGLREQAKASQQATAPDEAVITYGIESYGYLVADRLRFTLGDLATEIGKTYDLTEPHNAAVVQNLNLVADRAYCRKHRYAPITREEAPPTDSQRHEETMRNLPVRACSIVCQTNPEWGTWGVMEDRGAYYEIHGTGGGRVLDKTEAVRFWALATDQQKGGASTSQSSAPDQSSLQPDQRTYTILANINTHNEFTGRHSDYAKIVLTPELIAKINHFHDLLAKEGAEEIRLFDGGPEFHFLEETTVEQIQLVVSAPSEISGTRMIWWSGRHSHNEADWETEPIEMKALLEGQETERDDRHDKMEDFDEEAKGFSGRD